MMFEGTVEYHIELLIKPSLFPYHNQYIRGLKEKSNFAEYENQFLGESPFWVTAKGAS